MNTTKVEEMIDMLSEYADGELGMIGKTYLQDSALKLSHALAEDGIDEGGAIEEMMILIEADEDIPTLHSTVVKQSPMTRTKYKMTIYAIKEVYRLKDGKLRMEVLATRKEVKEETE